MLTDRAFACLLIAALLLCGAARFVVGNVHRDASASMQRQGLIQIAPLAPRSVT